MNNIFKDANSLYMRTPLYKVFDAIDGFFPLLRKIETELGEQAYVLHNYLKTIFNATDQTASFKAAEDAQRIFWDFRAVCSDILENKNELSDSPYYQFIKEHIDRHRGRYDEHFIISMAVTAAARYFAKELIQAYFDDLACDAAGNFDIVELRKMYRNISYGVGHDIDRLNEMIRNQFIIAPIGDTYVQAFLNHYLMELVSCEPVTSKLLYRWILEESGDGNPCT